MTEDGGQRRRRKSSCLISDILFNQKCVGHRKAGFPNVDRHTYIQVMYIVTYRLNQPRGRFSGKFQKMH